MNVFALSDPHLSYGTPGKEMDRFGAQWIDHGATIERHWREVVSDDDLVLVPGDISWAMRLAQARPDLEFLGRLPGQKVMVKGNHDYWWNSVSKVRHELPDGMHALQGDAIRIGDVALAGTRLWDVPDLLFADVIDWGPDPRAAISEVHTLEDDEQSRKIYRREIGRLERALEALDQLAGDASRRIVLTHYPPCGPAREPSEATRLCEAAAVHHVVFGHLHAVKQDLDPRPFGELNGIQYHLASCDYVGFRPVRII